MPLSPDCILPHQVPDIPLLRPATLTLTIFLLLLPKYLVLYNTTQYSIQYSDVALGLPHHDSVTSAVVEVTMSLVTFMKCPRFQIRAYLVKGLLR